MIGWLLLAALFLTFWTFWTLYDWAGHWASLLSDAYVEDPPPLETDQKKRDAVLKQRFNPEKVPNNLDAIVIGSGPGGLSAATFLARGWRKVLVLEQHDQAGGTCHTFQEKGFEFDTGLHYLGFLWDETSQFSILMNRLTEGKVVFDPIPGTADKVAIGTPGVDFREYKAFGGFVFDNLVEQFPQEKEKILKLKGVIDWILKQWLVIGIFKRWPMWFVNLVIKSGVLKWSLFKYHNMPFIVLLDEVGIDNKDLRACLTYMTSVIAMDATNCPVLLYALIVHMYGGPTQYPRGGPTEIPFQLIPLIERAGGRVLVDARVEEILVDSNGRANGVRVGKGLKECEIYAPIIISDAGVLTTFQNLLPQRIARESRYFKYIDEIGPSSGGACLFVGLDGTPEELGLPLQNIWYMSAYDTKEKTASELVPTVEALQQFDTFPGFFATCSNKKDTSWDSRFPGKSVVLIITLVQYEFVEKYEGQGTVRHRGEEYENLKNEVARSVWDTFCRMYPKVADKVEYFDVGTPLSYNHYLGTVRGEIYALDHGFKRMSPTAMAELRTKTDIPGLYLTGQDILFAGIPTAAASGMMTASEIMDRNLPEELIAMEMFARIARWLRNWLKPRIGENLTETIFTRFD